MSISKGIFSISLDFELYWGMQDKYTIDQYRENLNGVENAVNKMLDVFDQYNVHATWATVGFLFANDIKDLKDHMPENQPLYKNQNLDPYLYTRNNEITVKRYHFAPALINKINSYQGQEIGSHTFSHYYCLESGQTKEQFREDILAAVAIATSKNIKLKSLVFPRNQWNNDYLSVLHECGISCYRGNERSWLYKACNTENSKLFKRALRLIDAYINISGDNCYSLGELSTTKPYDIPSSRFLRPFTKKLSAFDGLRKNRIKQAINYAARNGKLYHLWWHPHNFGINTDENLTILKDILFYYEKMNKQYGMHSLNMGEISEELDLINSNSTY
ncbi:MAG: polysaccharide deacetylase family protein [Methylococcales bacterium]